jgi:hypothetical protein
MQQVQLSTQEGDTKAVLWAPMFHAAVSAGRFQALVSVEPPKPLVCMALSCKLHTCSAS